MMIFDTTAQVFRSDPEKLARLLELSEQPHLAFRQEELGAILRHQLRTQVEFELQSLDPGSQRLLRAAGEYGSATASIRTFADLFQHPHPPVQLLYLTKNFAKSHLNHPQSPLPPEITTILYYASIVCALLRWNRHITWLTHAELRSGLRRVLRFPWLDDLVRELFTRGLEHLDAADAPPVSEPA